MIKKIRPIMDKAMIKEDNSSQFPIVDEDYKEMIKEVLIELKDREKV